LDGREVNLEAYRDKVALIDFWATWCGPCVAKMPEVIEQYNKFHDQGFEIVGISFDDDKAARETFVKERELVWPQFFDGNGWENQCGKKYSINSIPSMWLVDKDGRIADFNAQTDLPSKIEKLLKSQNKSAVEETRPK
jgi:thiol-disulfide isomerase/thioredoxin